MKENFYIIHSEVIAHGIVFTKKTRYAKTIDRAMEIYEEEVKNLSENNKDMIEDKENYKITKGGKKGHKYFYCEYKYQSGVSEIFVVMDTANFE